MQMRRDVYPDCTSMLTVALALLLCCSASMADEPSGEESEGIVQVSIWDDSNIGINGAEERNLQSASGDATQEPILVPLPAPLFAAGAGLGLAWMVRKRMTRS